MNRTEVPVRRQAPPAWWSPESSRGRRHAGVGCDGWPPRPRVFRLQSELATAGPVRPDWLHTGESLIVFQFAPAAVTLPEPAWGAGQAYHSACIGRPVLQRGVQWYCGTPVYRPFSANIPFACYRHTYISLSGWQGATFAPSACAQAHVVARRAQWHTARSTAPRRLLATAAQSFAASAISLYTSAQACLHSLVVSRCALQPVL